MTVRSQTIALVVLFVAFGVIFLLVGNAGVATSVFLPGPTLTFTPTVGPTPTPLPEGVASNWSETQPGQLMYAANPGIQAQIAYQTMTLSSFVAGDSLTMPPEGDSLPELDVLGQIKDQLTPQIDQLGLTVTADTFFGPLVEKVNGYPVARLRTMLAPQDLPTQPFPGIDLEQIMVLRSDDQITFIQYQLQGQPDPVVYGDFRAWLAENIADFAGANAEATPTGSETPTPEGTPAESAAPVETPTPEATPVESAVPAETPAPEATPVESPVPDQATPAPTTSASGAADTVWQEIQPGQLVNTANPNAMIVYSQTTIDNFASQMQLSSPPASDDPNAINALLQGARDVLDQQITANSIPVDAENFVGPVTETIGGVNVSYIHIVSNPETLSDGTPNQMQELAIGMIDLGGGTIRVINLLYQGTPDATLFDSFTTWIEQNIDELTTLDLPTPTPEATPTQGSGN